VYAAIDLDTMPVLDIEMFSRHGTGSAVAFLHRLTGKHDLEETTLLVDGYGYSTALTRLGLSSRRDYTGRNHIERWFQSIKLRTDRFHTSWVGSRQAVREWCWQFRCYYNRQRPHQALDGRTPAEFV